MKETVLGSLAKFQRQGMTGMTAPNDLPAFRSAGGFATGVALGGLALL